MFSVKEVWQVRVKRTLESEEDEEGKVVLLLRGVVDGAEETEVIIRP
jgi:hypothetical protein